MADDLGDAIYRVFVVSSALDANTNLRDANLHLQALRQDISDLKDQIQNQEKQRQVRRFEQVKTLVDRGLDPEARQHLEELIREYPTDPYFRAFHAELHLRAADHRSAKEEFIAAQKLGLPEQLKWEVAARMYEAVGDSVRLAEARTALTRMVAEEQSIRGEADSLERRLTVRIWIIDTVALALILSIFLAWYSYSIQGAAVTGFAVLVIVLILSWVRQCAVHERLGVRRAKGKGEDS